MPSPCSRSSANLSSSSRSNGASSKRTSPEEGIFRGEEELRSELERRSGVEEGEEARGISAGRGSSAARGSSPARGGGGSGRPLPKFVLLWVVAARGVAGAWLCVRGGSPLRRVEMVVGATGASDLGVARSVAGVVGVGLLGCRCARAVGSSARSGRGHPALISGFLSCGLLTVPAWLPGPWPRVKLVEEIQIGGNPLVGSGRPRQWRRPRAPLFFLEKLVLVCSFTPTSLHLV